MIQGIQGFMDFTSTMVNEDITEIEVTNWKLRSCLPSKEWENLDKVTSMYIKAGSCGIKWKNMKCSWPHMTNCVRHLSSSYNFVSENQFGEEFAIPLPSIYGES